MEEINPEEIEWKDITIKKEVVKIDDLKNELGHIIGRRITYIDGSVVYMGKSWSD